MTNSSDHDLILKIHDRVFECPTKEDLRGCMSDHVRDLHATTDDPQIVIKGGKGNKIALAVGGALTAGVMAILAKLGFGL